MKTTIITSTAIKFGMAMLKTKNETYGTVGIVSGGNDGISILLIHSMSKYGYLSSYEIVHLTFIIYAM
jgi:hypothetical protein